jgi:hypothetical protein
VIAVIVPSGAEGSKRGAALPGEGDGTGRAARAVVGRPGARSSLDRSSTPTVVGADFPEPDPHAAIITMMVVSEVQNARRTTVEYHILDHTGRACSMVNCHEFAATGWGVDCEV